MFEVMHFKKCHKIGISDYTTENITALNHQEHRLQWESVHCSHFIRTELYKMMSGQRNGFVCVYGYQGVLHYYRAIILVNHEIKVHISQFAPTHSNSNCLLSYIKFQVYQLQNGCALEATVTSRQSNIELVLYRYCLTLTTALCSVSA
jgi:hypothetical protein